jgi:hypothetical protein
MAYQSKDLSVLAYANGFTLWHYASADTAVAVAATGYFNAAADMLRVGDMLIANVETAGNPKGGLFLVSTVSAGVVDVNDMTRISAAGAN